MRLILKNGFRFFFVYHLPVWSNFNYLTIPSGLRFSSCHVNFCTPLRKLAVFANNVIYSFISVSKKFTLAVFLRYFQILVRYHHHHIVPHAWISLTLSRHFSLSFIASGRFSWLHPVSSRRCCMYVRAGRPAFAKPCVGVHRTTLLMSSFLLFQQCPASLVRLTWIVFLMGGRWPYNWFLVGCCRQDLFNIARNILA